MAEQLDLTTPFGPTTNIWRVKTITLDLAGLTSNATAFSTDATKSVIRIVLQGLNNQTFPWQWAGTPTNADIIALNKANLSGAGGTLQKRLFDKLIADGVTPGTISGTPD